MSSSMSLRNILRISVALLALACVAAPSTVSACDYGMWGDVWGNYGWNYFRAPLRTGNLPTPPYFSIHPPVYYSGLQHRPYGDSPYAYYPERPLSATFVPGAFASTPRVIENPYVKGEATTASTSTKSKLIINPYYQPSDTDLATANQR